jgi:hypothetical protein
MIRILRAFFRAAVIETIAIGAIIWIVVASRTHETAINGKLAPAGKSAQSMTLPEVNDNKSDVSERTDFVESTLASSANALSQIVANYVDREIDDVLSQCDRTNATDDASNPSFR